MNDTHDERGGDESSPFRDDLRTQLVTAGTEAAEQWLTVRANRKMSDVNRKRLAGHVVNALWDEIERAAVEMAEHVAAELLAAATARAESATVLPERWRALIAERDAANERAEKAEALVAEASVRADKFCGAFSDAGSLAYRRGKLLDAALTRQTELAKQRDEARAQMYLIIGAVEHAYALNAYVELEPGEEAPTIEALWAEVREIRGVAPDAAPEALSGPVERSETSGGHGEGSNSRATTAGLSEPEGGCPWCGTLQKLDADGLISLHRLPNDLLCPGGTRRPNDDTTEDGQHG